MKLLLGTTNLGKIQSYKKYLIHGKLELLTLQELGVIDEPLEIGKTAFENALQKARYYAEKTELPCMGDDGVFEIDFLDGQPGVNAKRWVGPYGTDEDRIEKVYNSLKGVPKKSRTARIKTSVVVYFPDVRDYLEVEGSVHGEILSEPSEKREKGLPYRSVLFLKEFNKHYVDLDEEELTLVGHREKICKELLLKLEPYINS